ncbi:type I methionyl aminopeptidase [Patescibacteria group bacterium]|nr:type I methionyl aminopeptidase [Patescibacteria group bacterium]
MSQIPLKTEEQIAGIRRSSRLAAETLKFTAGLLNPGVSTLMLNDAAHEFIVSHHATPAPLGYNGYPKSICTSVNNIVCHGIPSANQILRNGDIINIDITTVLDSYYGDVSATYPVGEVSEKASKLISRTRQALELAIKELSPGKYLNACVGQTIEKYLAPFNYGIVRLLGGHGVGLRFHEEPFVYHFDTHQDDVLLQPGMIFTIEPMVNSSPNWDVVIDKKDGWTVRTVDGALSCQFEHTVLITPTGHEILTKLD